MLSGAFGLPHLIIILVILLLLFGAPKLPALAKSVAQSMKIFRTEMSPAEKREADTSSETPTNQNAAAGNGSVTPGTTLNGSPVNPTDTTPKQ